jgi:hypothetical protein
MPDLIIQKAGSASDVVTKNNNRAIYGNILGQEIAAEAGIIARVTRQGGGGGAASSRNVSAIGGTIFTYAERAAVVSNIIANTATNPTNAAILAAAASDIGVTVTSPFLATNANTPAVVLWTPINSVGLNVWLDGADPAGTGTPPSSGATVSTWADKSGNSYSTTSVVGTPAPTYNPTNGIVMNGTSYFTLPNGSIPFNNSSYSIYSVVKSSNISTRGWFGAGGTTGSTGISLRVDSGPIRIYWNENDLLTTASVVQNVTFLFATQYQTAGQRTAFFNGSAVGSDTPSSARSQPNTGNVIGKTVDTAPMPGSIGEVLVYSVTHTLAQRQQIEGYLAWKWGLQTLLPITHLYYSAAPRL